MAPVKDIIIPELGMTTDEVAVELWLKAVGDPVRRGEPIVELTTDKASMPLEATDDGVLAEILVEPGVTIPVLTVIGRLDLGTSAQAPAGAAAPAAPAAAKVRATPVARRMARDHGVALETVAGSGPAGRIRRADVESVIAAPAVAATPAPATPAPVAPVVAGRRKHLRLELSPAQRRLAGHLVANAVPQFSVGLDIDLTAVLEVPREAGGPTFSDVLIKAVAMTARRHEHLNASYDDGELLLWDDVNVGFALAVGPDLHAPVVRGADRLGVRDIALRRKELTQRARDGGLGPSDTADATIMVSNMGALGVTHVHAVVSPPQVCIIGVGAPVDRLVPAGGGFHTRRIASFWATCDHRAANGASAAAFLRDLADRLSSPFVLGEA